MLRSDSQPGPIVLRGRSPEKCLRQHSGHGRDQQAVLQTVHSRSLRARPVAGNEEGSRKGTGRHLRLPTWFHPVRIAAAERRHRMPTAGRRISQVVHEPVGIRTDRTGRVLSYQLTRKHSQYQWFLPPPPPTRAREYRKIGTHAVGLVNKYCDCAIIARMV
uniref:(northern house mosquito) hypothetical protein n=1 Tax=Culex pipiens TaxID=7175 RepID=A0A8D8AVE8_CULPI